MKWVNINVENRASKNKILTFEAAASRKLEAIEWQ